MAETIPQEVIDAAQAEQAKWWVPSSVSIAQWCLESNYGKSMPPDSNNPFGIKAKSGQPSVVCPTHEEVHGHMIATTAAFRKFASLKDAFNSHGQLLHHPTYAKAMAARMNADNFANALTGVYATDSNYGSKLIALMKAHNLYQYNNLKGVVMTTQTPTGPVASKTPGTNAAIWMNVGGAFLSMLAGFTQYLPPQYAAVGTLILAANGVMHQMTGNAGNTPSA
jgi:hypothetical protein